MVSVSDNERAQKLQRIWTLHNFLTLVATIASLEVGSSSVKSNRDFGAHRKGKNTAERNTYFKTFFRLYCTKGTSSDDVIAEWAYFTIIKPRPKYVHVQGIYLIHALALRLAKCACFIYRIVNYNNTRDDIIVSEKTPALPCIASS